MTTRFPGASLALPALAWLGTPAAAAQCPRDELVASDGAIHDRFGQALSLKDGRALIAATFDHPTSFGSGSGTGAAYVYEETAAGWVELAKLVASDGAAVDQFGFSVAIDGGTALVGAVLDDDLGQDSGSAYVFEEGPGGWTQTAKLNAGDGAAFDRFGYAAALEGDTAVVAANQFLGGGPGKLYVFERQGSVWVQTEVLVPASAEAGDRFGSSLALDGDRLVAGAPLDDDAGADAGAAYVFERTPQGWAETAKLVASSGLPGDELGIDVALDGDAVAAGAWQGFSGGAGAVRVFELQGAQWVEAAQLTAADGEAGDLFGFSVGLSGGALLVGSRFDDDAASKAGSVYLFEETGAGWTGTAHLLPEEPAVEGEFGYSLALQGGLGLIGAIAGPGATAGSGSVYAYTVLGLCGSPSAVSLAAGGSHSLDLKAGAALAGELFLVLGSASGTAPGIPLDGLLLPLAVPDPYFNFTLGSPGTPPLTGSLGSLDPAGEAAAAFTLPPGTLPSLAGLLLHHAFLVLDVAASGQAVFASNAVAVSLVP